MNTFAAGDMVAFAWDSFKKRPWALIGALVVVIFVSWLTSTIVTDAQKSFAPDMWLVGIVAFACSFAISTLVKMGQVNFLIKANDAIESVQLKDLWAPHPFWKFLGASICVGVIVIVGFILLIVPGVIWGLRYMFTPYIIMDKKLSIGAALKESARITDGHKWDLALFALSILGINILGFICLLVGLLVTVPVTELAYAHAYRTLSGGALPITPATPAMSETTPVL